MLKIAGERFRQDRFCGWPTKAIGDHIAPAIQCRRRGLRAPGSACGGRFRVCGARTSEVDAARERANRAAHRIGVLARLPASARSGNARDAGDLILAGDEDAIAAGFQRYIDAGVTEHLMRLLPIGDTREELRASATAPAKPWPTAKDLRRSVGEPHLRTFETLARSSHRPQDQEGGRVLWCSSGVEKVGVLCERPRGSRWWV